MPSAEPTRLTDDLWLAAHDSLRGTTHLGDRALGVGLATGLLAELLHGGFLNLRDGELFRTTRPAPDDPALSPLLEVMAAEESTWPQTPPVRARASVRARDEFDWPPWSPERQHRPAQGRQEERHRRRGHDLGVWLPYLAYDGRAEQRVVERLSRSGLVQRRERRRLFGGTAVQYLPYDSNIAGGPANTITSAIRRRDRLPPEALLLAGLFLATGLHHHALATLSPDERSGLAEQLHQGLDGPSWELLRAADAAVGAAAMR
jgi:hypothetical protein